MPPPNPRQIVYLVDDEESVRRSLTWLIESVGVEVQAFATPSAFLDVYDPDTPGCLILDVRMPEFSGLELQERLLAQNCRLPILFITGHGDVPMAVRAMRNGAFDFIQKPFNDQALLESVQMALEENSKEFATRQQSAGISRRLAELTEREQDVLRELVAGRTNKEIARTLGISPKTVETYRANVMRKTEAGSVAELVSLVSAAKNG